mmetsp:Transcript_9607/g.23820  ORF Transcript_9607/g.23820 Transcript_9607/m.23820 type:complete len:223 (+) Transcript_9607:793-1461(+)
MSRDLRAAPGSAFSVRMEMTASMSALSTIFWRGLMPSTAISRVSAEDARAAAATARSSLVGSTFLCSSLPPLPLPAALLALLAPAPLSLPLPLPFSSACCRCSSAAAATTPFSAAAATTPFPAAAPWPALAPPPAPCSSAILESRPEIWASSSVTRASASAALSRHSARSADISVTAARTNARSVAASDASLEASSYCCLTSSYLRDSSAYSYCVACSASSV